MKDRIIQDLINNLERLPSSASPEEAERLLLRAYKDLYGQYPEDLLIPQELKMNEGSNPESEQE